MSEINTLGNEYETYFRDGIVDWEHLEQREIRSEYLSDPNHVVNTYLWHKEMAEYIKNTLGHTEHLLTVSYAGEPDPIDLSYSIPEIDVLGFNLYQNAHLGKTFHYIDRINYYNQQFQKPVLIAETGPLEENACDFGISFKQIAWKLPFTGLAGFNMWVGLNEGTNNENLMRWNELKKVQNFIYNDPEIKYALQNQFTAKSLKSQIIYDDYALKEMTYLVGSRSNADAHKVFGVMLNLSDNYYTNATDENSFCKFSDKNKISLDDNLISFRSKQFMTTLDNYIAPNQFLPNESYGINWYNFNDLSINSYSNFVNGANSVFEHPMFCITGQCSESAHTNFSLLPFSSNFSVRNATNMWLLEDSTVLKTNLISYQEKDEEKTDIRIQPNPSSEKIRVSTIQIERKETNSVFKIIDASGRVLDQKTLDFDVVIFDIENYIPGMYYIQLYQDKQLLKTEKWIKSAY